MNITYFGVVGGLLMLLIGSLKSPSLRANHRLPLWRASDPYGRLAMVGMAIFTLTAIVRLITSFSA